MRTFTGIDDLKASVGEEIGVSEWFEVTQAVIDAFAEATGDFQFIHVDPEKAKQTPLGGTIAHGLLTLSLGPRFSYELWTVENIAMALNYGFNKVRFPSPVPVGSRLRAHFKLLSLEHLPPQLGKPGAQLVWEVTIEREGSDKPVCVAESVSRRYG